MSFYKKFSSLGKADRIWTISAVNGQLGPLVGVHKSLHAKFVPGDRIVYTGNYMGGDKARGLDTLNEILFFRRTLLAMPGTMAGDIVYLRGIQEELLDKLLQLQFAPQAGRVVAWMEENEPAMDQVLRAYGSSLKEAGRVSREGVMSMTRWVAFLKKQIRRHTGHEVFFSGLKRAAFTEKGEEDNLLFVHAGIDPSAPLQRQGDSFWWKGREFNAQDASPAPFRSVVRGYDPGAEGVKIGEKAISLDGGCGRGGKLVCARLSDTGDVQEVIAA